MHTRFAPVLALCFLPGCYTAFVALDAPDGGSRDAPMADAASADAASADAGAPPDAPRGDGGPCTGDIEWIDTSFETVPVDPAIAPQLVASADGFELFYQHATFEICDGPCPVLVRIPTRGARETPRVAYWADPSPTALFAGAGEGGAASFATVTGRRVLWIGAPSGAEPWITPQADFTIPDPRSVGAIAFRGADVLVVTQGVAADEAGRPGRSELPEVRQYSRAGAVGPRLDELDPTSGFSFWSPRLAVSSSGEVWLGVLQDIDFPPTVMLAHELGPLGWDGSACGGVESFDLAAEDGSSSLSVQDCGAYVHLSRRMPAARVDVAVAASRDTEYPVASAIAARADRVAVVHRGADGVAHVVVLDRDLAILASGDVPGSEVFPAETFPGPLDLAAHADGTFAVLTTTRVAGTFSEGAVLRFRVCE